MNEWPRRSKVYEFSVGEKAIYDAIQVVETMGADPLLTDAINLLHEAQEKVADFVDKPAIREQSESVARKEEE